MIAHQLASAFEYSRRNCGVVRSPVRVGTESNRDLLPLLLAFMSSRVHASDRDDLHQDIWQRVWASLPVQFQGGNFRAWLHQIARNAIIDLGRKKRPGALTDPLALVDGRSERAGSLLLEQERKAALERCLKALKSELAELEAVHSEQPGDLSMADVLRDRRDAVLSRGLASLPAEGLKTLLRNPLLLLELQELILTEGGPPWLDGAAEAASKQDDLKRAWNRLNDPLPQTSRAAVLPVAPPPPHKEGFLTPAKEAMDPATAHKRR